VPTARREDREAARADSVRRARLRLAIVCALGLAAQVAIVGEQLARDPFATTPINDAQVYWQWAGEIARGKLVGATPFLSAPLYPYFVGSVRALGGGLAAVYALQVAMHVATALLVHRIASRRFSERTAIVAAALWFLLADPAYYTARILNCTLQALVVAALWERMLALADRPRASSGVVVGVLLGLNVLANPTMLVAVPIVAAWVFWIAAPSTPRVRIASAVLAASLATIAPATLHNWLACRELIPVSAQAGVTFFHGNAPGADGTYHAIPGISGDRMRQNLDARELVKGTTDGSWKATSAAFFDKGFAFWRAEPMAFVRLVARKVYWFASGQSYGDIYIPRLEIEDGFASLLVLAPVPVAWWMLPTLCLLALALREGKRTLPEILLFALPLATVAVFWYSPRYRFPALPIGCVIGAQALCDIASANARRGLRVALAFSLALGIAAGFVNAATGFDRAETHRGQYELSLGNVLVAEDRLDEALEHYQRALEHGERDAGAALADVLRRLGRSEEAIERLRDAARAQPGNAYVHKSLAVALAQSHELAEAEREFETALRIDPDDWESLSGLGNVYLESNRPEAAIEKYRAALRLHPAFDVGQYNLGCAEATLHHDAAAEAAFRAALDANAGFAPACRKLVEILVARGDFKGAIVQLRATLAHAADRSLESELAWQLATAPSPSDRDPRAALEIAEQLDRDAHHADAGALDTLAAALAANGRFAEAEDAADRSVELARSAGFSPELVRAMQTRRDLYRAHREYRQMAH
jgi:tetratricopeptide (TPR) repeat protein